jgi:hypothetical protein
MLQPGNVAKDVLPGHKPQEKKLKESRTESFKPTKSAVREITPEEHKDTTGRYSWAGFGFPYPRGNTAAASMKKAITIAAVIGVNVGIFWVSIVAARPSIYTPLTPVWTAIMWASCPPIAAMRTAWWLVPILNGILYVVVVGSVRFLRRFIVPFAK